MINRFQTLLCFKFPFNSCPYTKEFGISITVTFENDFIIASLVGHML